MIKPLSLILNRLWPVLFITTAVSCAVPIKDQEWCGDLGDKGASCFHTLTPATYDVDKKTWDAMRFGQVCTAAQNFADTKAALEKLCRETRNCKYEALQKFFNDLEGFQLANGLK